MSPQLGYSDSRQGPTRFRSEGSADAVAGALFLCRAIAISDPAPGTTCGNHRANFPRHLGTSPRMVFAVQLYELTPRAGTTCLPLYALQARSRWFEPTCAHQVSAARWPFETLIRDSVTTAGNHRCMLPDAGRVPSGPGSIPFDHQRAVRRRQAPGPGRLTLAGFPIRGLICF